jgi:hypothetical protein
LLISHPVALDGEPVFGIAFVVHVVGRISEDQIGRIAVHQARDIIGIGGIADQQNV